MTESTSVSADTARQTGVGRVILAAVALLLPVSAALAVVFVVAGGSDESAPVRRGTIHSLEIPLGTAELRDRGLLTEDVLPREYTIDVGDTIEIVNDDVVVHTYGPFTVRPGEKQSLTFDEPGFFFGVCTASDHDTVTITVV